MTTLSTRERAAALAVLGLPPQATPGQVTQAYRRLARSAHPDGAATEGTSVDRERAAADTRPASGPRYAAPRFGSQQPIVAGPVMVSPLPARGRTDGRRRRAR